MPALAVHHPTRILRGTVQLPLSKSESNRLLIISALAQPRFTAIPVSEAEDTRTMQRLLELSVSGAPDGTVYDVGPAGTPLRFLTAYFATQPGVRVLTGSPRMQERPMGVLVEALRSLGADIVYLEREGFAPLQITGKRLTGGEVVIDGSVSSQFISALLLIAPLLHKGLVIRFTGEVVSVPYINMTMRMMERYGAAPLWHDDVLSVSHSPYYADHTAESVEADWSAASYWFSMAALADEADLFLPGLRADSLQGDRMLADLYPFFGVRAAFENNGLRLTKNGELPFHFGFDFGDCPDAAQTVAVTAAGLRIPLLMNGLETLVFKETDRIAALQRELEKLGVASNSTTSSLELMHYAQQPGAVAIETYHDHRMAMAFSALALRINEVLINDAEVVKKSYPAFWDEMRGVGFVMTER